MDRPKPELKQAVSYELGNDFFTSPSKIMFAGEPLGLKRDMSVPKKISGAQSGYFGQGGGQKSARSKPTTGSTVFTPNQAMYTSSLLDFGSKRDGLKSTSNASNHNMSANIMFGFPKTGGGASNTNPMKASTYNDMPLSQYYDTILNNRIETPVTGGGLGLSSAGQGSRNSLMFRSQSLHRSSSGGLGMPGSNKGGSSLNSAQREFKAFTLPPEVTKFLEEEPIRVRDLGNKIALEKAKLDKVLDDVLKDVTILIEGKRKTLHQIIDAFMDEYKANKEIFERQFRSFKDTKGILGTNKFGGSGDRLISLDSIEYHDLHGKTKEETCKMTLRLASLTKEIERRLLTHYSNLLEKDLCHAPNLSDTETAKEYMRDMHRDIMSKVSSDLEILDSLVYSPEVLDFGQIKIKPHFRPALGESKTNVIYNVGNLVAQDVVDRLQVEYISMGTGLDKVSCLHVVEEDLLATGHCDNSVAVWSMTKGIKSATLKEHNTPVTALASIKAYFGEISSSPDRPDPSAEPSMTRSQLVTESQYIPSPGVQASQSPSASSNKYLKSRNTKQQNFLISGSQGPEADIIVWDLLSHTKLRCLQGHKDTVTSLITLRDGHTLISGSLDCNLLIWDVASETPAQVVTEASEVYCMHAFNDFSHFIVGCKLGEMNIYRIHYVYNRRYERATFESCKKIKTIRSSQPVFCLNESLLRENTVFAGGADRLVVVWNTVTCAEKTKFSAHQTEVVGCVLVENPLKHQGNSFVLSFGNYDDKMVITDTFSGESREVVLDQNVSLSAGRFSNPNLQLMSVTDVFGKSQTYLLVAGSRHGLPCLLKVLIPHDEEDHQVDGKH